MSRIERKTKETTIHLEVVRGTGALDEEGDTRAVDGGTSEVASDTSAVGSDTSELGGGTIQVETGDTFLDHMLVTLARYAGLGLRVEASGDLRHHLVEDVAIALGSALADEVPAHATRYGSAIVPMDEALVQAAIDVGGRPFYVGRVPSKLYEHFLQSFATNLRATLHVRVLRGRDRHHAIEAAVKATGLALRQALREGEGVFSTKGPVSIERENGEG